MRRVFSLSHLSLRAKLALSYLLVALGAILILTIVVLFVIQNYFASAQLDQIRREADYVAGQIGKDYGTPDALKTLPPLPNSNLNLHFLVLIDANGNVIQGPALLVDTPNPAAGALVQALQGQQVQGRIQFSLRSQTLSVLYISEPIRAHGQADGQIIGALLIVEPEQYPQGAPPNEFLLSINIALMVSGVIVAAIVVLLSFVIARRLTRSLESLTLAAEKMKVGQYTERVTAPKSQDELGQLASTFNAMADTIEADVNELRRQEQVRRDLIANIAHELATPLTAIQGFSEALADDLIHELTARQETALLIGREVQRLRRLVADMQNMTALESGHTQLDLAPLNIGELVDETLTVIAPECEQVGIAVQNDIPLSIPLVLADSDRITQVLLNLLDNARRHTQPGGSIHVGTAIKGNDLLVSVSDTGVGIDPADLPHIFERFYRADRSRTGATGGSGLGLSIVKAIIIAHGGTIWAESNPGQGTRILFTLPLVTGVL